MKSTRKNTYEFHAKGKLIKRQYLNIILIPSGAIKIALFIQKECEYSVACQWAIASETTIRCRHYWPEATDSSLCADVLGEYAFPLKRKDSGKEARSIKLRWNERSRQNAPIIRLTSGSLGSPQVEKRNETGDVTINRELVSELFALPRRKAKQKQVLASTTTATTIVMHS